MSSLNPSSGGGVASPRALDSVADRNAILDQLGRVLTSSLFRNSKRCRPLLQYIVRETLDRRGESLKERSLGVCVFRREPTYDTNADPIVRSSAAEVRKRIAQYYHEPGHESELRIELTAGSYVPHFYAPAGRPPAETNPAADTKAATASPRRVSMGRIAIAAGAGLAVVLGGIWVVAARREAGSPMRDFWAPIAAGETVIVAAGDVNENPAPGGESGIAQSTFAQINQHDQLGFADGLAMARVAGLLAARGSKAEIRRAGSLTLTDLRRSPAVLIGEMNNPWTKLLEGEMRFRFIWDTGTSTVRLHDQRNPQQPLWQLEWNTPYSALKEDRAIITRIIDPRTEHAVLVLAGCGRDGTTAAAEFVTDPRYLDELARQAPSGWARRNLQAVLATTLVNGHSGPPRILATHFW
jgi:hypothetical protein